VADQRDEARRLLRGDLPAALGDPVVAAADIVVVAFCPSSVSSMRPSARRRLIVP